MTAAVTTLRVSERKYFVAVWLSLAMLVAAGFAKSYYLRAWFHAPPLPTLVQVHGAVMTAWVVVLGAQIALIVARRPDWHRRLGWAGIGVGALVVLLGCTTTLAAAAREVAGHTAQAPTQLTILGLELTQMLLFATLTGAALWLRQRPGDHKRLMILATACLMPSPLSRLPLSFGSNAAILMWFDLLVVAIVLADALRRSRLEPGYGWGAALLLGGLNAAYVAAQTPGWHRFAAGLVS